MKTGNNGTKKTTEQTNNPTYETFSLHPEEGELPKPSPKVADAIQPKPKK